MMHPHPVPTNMNQSRPTNQEEVASVVPVEDTFLSSLYRTTLLTGMVGTAGIAIALQSAIWAGSFIFGVLISLVFLKSQELFLKRMLQARAPHPQAEHKDNKAPKTLWLMMIGKYFVLAGIMAAALHFNVLNLISFVLGFALLHAVMVIKVVARRGAAKTGGQWSLPNNSAKDVAHQSTLN